ncbi:hypothetical protein GUO57_004558 [Salmonella enterica]|uniref:hypothetical protein n=1 Tax=Salmonella enterica TaxID=28901 RepID=UPI000FA5E828|nr:hypothetical protein [Salmonella enterica]EBX0472528.1 hypothetical protein [Salmonella enterica subsp. enterica serovar Havana]ECC1750598.1 hypothetical protein [Salmonella enterica subsp. diarizonae]ECF0055599.1 hypothetical protein [Salmonella enterica subsp. enterica serovar Coeln]ECF6858200.1 hypothetical protein [Salmonella enterica subsp. arizonae]ECH8535553.1 hypothetical protein [Salmonella enterica subsp. enterica serovar Lexington]ECI6901385.1 hypothetical protein [Salmonella en
MTDNIIKVNKGNYSYTITVINNELLQVVKYVKTRSKHTTGKTKREVVFDENLTREQAFALDGEVLKARLLDFLKGVNNEE